MWLLVLVHCRGLALSESCRGGDGQQLFWAAPWAFLIMPDKSLKFFAVHCIQRQIFSAHQMQEMLHGFLTSVKHLSLWGGAPSECLQSKQSIQAPFWEVKWQWWCESEGSGTPRCNVGCLKSWSQPSFCKSPLLVAMHGSRAAYSSMQWYSQSIVHSLLINFR